MASIFTRKGEEILIDDEDLDFVSQFTWWVDGRGYPAAYVPGSGRVGRKVRLHKILREGRLVNHVNGNKLDARQKNLEPATYSVNNQKSRKSPDSGIRAKGKKFEAYLKVDDKQVYLGIHKTFDLALLARVIGEIRYWGEPTQQMP